MTKAAQPGKILALHLYDPTLVAAMFRKLRPLSEVATEVWCASRDPSILEAAAHHCNTLGLPSRMFHVDNRWHDWSGYAEFLGHYRGQGQLCCCNDSLLSRRVVSARTLRKFVRALEFGPLALVGELDTRAQSIDLQGWSSACWISTYLFAIRGFALDRAALESEVERQVAAVLEQPQHPLLGYLGERRAGLMVAPEALRAKLGAMLFERWLTRIATERGATIIDYCDGDLLRKLERKLERLRDG